MSSAFLHITKRNIDEYLLKYNIIACRLRNSRLKAKRVAIMELFMALLPLESVFLVNGPLSDKRGFVCFMIPNCSMETLSGILSYIGYCDTFFILDFGDIKVRGDSYTGIERGTWKGRGFSVLELFRQCSETYDAQSPHNRPFVIIDGRGERRSIKGYRGDGSAMGRRALPVEDCRCLVNLAIPSNIAHLVDPFAGAGGIVYAAQYINPDVNITTVDIEPLLAPGLEMLGSKHFVEDAGQIQLPHRYDALVTEVPFDPQATPSVLKGLKNTLGYLTPQGTASVMCSSQQFHMIEQLLVDAGMHIYCAHEINRKGTGVAIIAATQDPGVDKRAFSLAQRVETVY
ncbi:MAG TPA: hypothetical protein VFD89_08940 [Clostridia bacterium]|nr:hypothetical protein [Clostridia bacterium]